MLRCKLLSPLFLLLIMIGCGKSLPELNGVNLAAWKEDRLACNGQRTAMMEAMILEKDKLKALSELNLVKLLGRPDENQLLDRNQKIYTYYLEPGPDCDAPQPDARKLVLRINAMGRAKETLIK